MSDESAVGFLVALGQALSADRLYAPEHPARIEALDRLRERAGTLLRSGDRHAFTFLEGEVMWGDHRLPALASWPWSSQLRRAGIERLELLGGLAPEELEAFYRDVSERLVHEEERIFSKPLLLPHLRYGRLAKESEEERRQRVAGVLPDLSHLQEQARRLGEVSPEVARAVVRTVGRALRETGNALSLLVPLRETDEYVAVHAMNVSLLSIGFAEQRGYRGTDIRRVGESALLHDLGQTLVSGEILGKRESLDREEWEAVRRHPEDGARILLRSAADLTLPAVVAYEHHMHEDGGGYPPRRYRRDPHPVTRLVRVCDVFDALRTRRPFRPAWPAERIFHHLEEKSDTIFHRPTVEEFRELVRLWEREMQPVAKESE